VFNVVPLGTVVSDVAARILELGADGGGAPADGQSPGQLGEVAQAR
jgi:hypothetical protein